MKGHGEKITRKQEQAIAALLVQPTLDTAARHAGISSATLWRWLRDKDFQEAYRTARRQVVEAAVGCIQRATSEAVEALRRNLACGQPSTEVQAAKVILDQAFRAMELLDLAARVDELEQVIVEEDIDVAQ